MSRLSFIALARVAALILASFVYWWAAADSFGGGTLRTIALSGQQAPGMPAGTQFSYFESIAPTINELGQTAFQARLRTGDENVNYSIWSEGSGVLAPLAVAGMAAPGIPPERPFGSINDPLINNAGATLFRGDLEWRYTPEFPGDVILGNHKGLWSDRRGTLELVARMGDSAPGAPDGIVLDYFDWGSVRFNDSGNIALLARFDHKIDNDFDELKRGIWSEGGGNGLQLVALSGMEAPGIKGSLYRQLHPPLLNNQGHVVFTSSLQTIPGAQFQSQWGLWSDRSGSVELVLRQNQHLPIAPNLSAPAVGFPYFAFNGNDDIAVSTIVRISDTDVRRGLWLDREGDILPIVIGGDRAPGTPANTVFERTSRPALNDFGQLAFSATLTSSQDDAIAHSGSSSTDHGIWFHDGNELRLIARVGDLVPDESNGAQFRFLRNPVLNARGQVAFSGYAATADDVQNGRRYTGLWVADPGEEPRLLMRTGVPIDVDDGPGTDLRTLLTIDFTSSSDNLNFRPSSGANDGQGRIFNDCGQLTFHGRFEDGSYGIFVIDTLSVPEPNSIVFMSICILVLLWGSNVSQKGLRLLSKSTKSDGCHYPSRNRYLATKNLSMSPRLLIWTWV